MPRQVGDHGAHLDTAPASHGAAPGWAGTVEVVPTLVLLAVGFVAMEPLTYATHRWLMHGPGRRLHHSHHAPHPARRWQANDLFPLGFAIVVMAAMGVGFNVAGWGWLVPLGVGITLYGAAYALVHDVYAHRRAPLLRGRHASLDRLATAHALHHRFGGEPYGMLVPLVPRRAARCSCGRGSDPAAPEWVDAVPRACRAIGLEAGEQRLAVPALGSRAGDDVAVGLAGVGEGARRSPRRSTG